MKTALAKKHTDPGRPDMAPSENTDLATQVAELRSDVRHLQSDVSDIKGDLRALNQRVDTKFEDVNKKIDARFERADRKFEETLDSINSTKLWAIGLYIALAGTLLYVVARSAKWI